MISIELVSIEHGVWKNVIPATQQSENKMTAKQQRHDTGDNNVKQQSSKDSDRSENDKQSSGRPDKGGTAGQSGGEEAKNRSSNPKSVEY